MVSICTGNIFFFSSHTYINLPRRIYVTPLLSHNKGHTTRQRVCVIRKRVCSWYYYRVDDETDTTLSHMCAVTNLASLRLNRRSVVVEIDEDCVAPAVQRLKKWYKWLWSLALLVPGQFLLD
jgi:hypothetical protein